MNHPNGDRNAPVSPGALNDLVEGVTEAIEDDLAPRRVETVGGLLPAAQSEEDVELSPQIRALVSNTPSQ